MRCCIACFPKTYKELMATNPDDSPVTIELDEVFHLD
jgi:L-rhamnose mutarotase